MADAGAVAALGSILGAAASALRPDQTWLDADRLDLRDPALIARVLPVLRRFTHGYCGLRVEGLERLPSGPVLYVGNQSGGILGADVLCTLATLWDALGADAPLYALAPDFAISRLRPLGRFVQRFGAMRASAANATRALDAGGSVLAYPGGASEAYRHASRRDEIVLGRRTGFIRVAQETGVPIVPIVAHGAHRSAYVFHEGAGLAHLVALERWAGAERMPLALPWGVAIGPWTPYAPSPFPIRLRVLAPMPVAPDQPPAHARETIRARMREALDDLAGARRPHAARRKRAATMRWSG